MENGVCCGKNINEIGAKESSQVETELSVLDMQISFLENTINLLEDKLSPILKPQLEADNELKNKLIDGTLSPIAENIYRKKERITDLSMRLNLVITLLAI